MIISFLPQVTWATWQKPVKEITNIELTHQVDTTPGKDNIFPNISLEWTIPEENDLTTQGTSGDGTKEPTSYIVNFQNTVDGVSGEDVISGDFSEYKASTGRLAATFGYKGIKEQNRDLLKEILKSGSLYKVTITPSHNHYVYNKADGSYYPVKAQLDERTYPNATPKYLITDFNMRAETKDGLTFKWEFIPGVSYSLYYDVVDINENVSTPTDITNNPVTITAAQAVELAKGNNEVVYSVDESKIQPGQIYAACVIPQSVQANSENKLPSNAIGNVAYNKTSPKIVYATPEIPLNISSVGENKIRLSWNMPSWLQIDEKNLKGIVIQSRKVGSEEWEDMATIYRNPYYFDCNKPEEDTEYRLVFNISNNGNSNASNIMLYTTITQYIADEGVDVPFAPRVPKEFPVEAAKKDIESYLDKNTDYLTKIDANYDDIELSWENIDEFAKHTFHYSINESKSADIQLVWDAEKNSETGEPNFNLYYDIWVSDTKQGLNTVSKYYTDLLINKENAITKGDKTVVGLKTTIENLAPNKTYYIKIVAKRKPGDTKYQSLPTVVSITVDKLGDVYNPPSLGKPPLQVEAKKEGDVNELAVKWTEEWYEIAAKNASQLYGDTGEDILARYGMGRIYLYSEDGKPYLRFKEPQAGTNNVYELYGKQSDVFNKLKQIKTEVDTHHSSGYYNSQFIENHVLLGSDTKYEMIVMKESEVDEQRGDEPIEKWVANFTTTGKAYSWEPIDNSLVTTIINDVPGKMYNITVDYKKEELKANTTYLIMMRTSRVVDGKPVYNVMPSYILGTTLSEHVSKPTVPKTPILKLDKVSSSSIKVKWDYDETFDYELRYSRLDDPDKAEVWTFTEEDKKAFVNGQTAYATVTGLLPETTYNLWIKAKQKQDNVQEGQVVLESDWSTPVTCKTLILDAPTVPQGLGLASYQSIQEAGKDFQPKGEGYLTVEWMRISEDVNNTDERRAYAYVLEMADNPEFRDAITVRTESKAAEENQNDNNQNANGNKNENADDKENDTENKEKEKEIASEVISVNIIRFDNLRPNAKYYFRVKSELTFTDGDKVIKKESEFTSYIGLITSKSNSEYDGGANPNIIEYETPVIETYKNDIWTYEMVDAAKLTTQILSNKQYNFTVTLKNYKGKYDAITRRLKMPVKIMSTLSNQGMNLQLVTNIGTYQIPGEALKSYYKQYSGTDTLQIDLTRKSSTDIASYIRPLPDNYVAGEQLQIVFRSEGKSTKVNTLNKPMTVKMNSEAPGNYNYENLYTYSYNYAKGNWDSYTYQVDTENNKLLTFKTAYPGLNALYSRSIADGSSNSSYIMNALASNYNILGLGTPYNEKSIVSSSQYVALMLGIARNKQNINLPQGASEADYKAAKSAGIYSGGQGNVTREQALAGVVKLYEIKHGNKIKTSNMKFPGVSAAYSEAASKAYAIGMIEEMTGSKAYITYGELCDWIALAIE